jgi:hypothetical protein
MVGLALAVASLASCSRKQAPEPAVATPAVTLQPRQGAAWQPDRDHLSVRRRGQRPSFAENCTVFVGVVDADEVLMWTDDHLPSVPTTEWKPDRRSKCTRTVFVPISLYRRRLDHMGLLAGHEEALVRSGTDGGSGVISGDAPAPPQTENVFTVNKEGWNGPETAVNNSSVEWQWTKKEDARIQESQEKTPSLSRVDNPSRTFRGSAHPGETERQVVYEFSVVPEGPVLRKIPLTPAQLATARWSKFTSWSTKRSCRRSCRGLPARIRASSAFECSTRSSSPK